MSQHYEKHAEKLVSAFLGMLDESVRPQIGENHRQQLAMLIESAISTAVLEQLEHTADEIADFAVRLRRRAEHYEHGA